MGARSEYTKIRHHKYALAQPLEPKWLAQEGNGYWILVVMAGNRTSATDDDDDDDEDDDDDDDKGIIK